MHDNRDVRAWGVYAEDLTVPASRLSFTYSLRCNEAGILYSIASVVNTGGVVVPLEMVQTVDTVIGGFSGLPTVGVTYGEFSQQDFAPIKVLGVDWMDPAPGNLPAGITMTANPAEWSLTHTPAVGVRATITRAAVAGARHVCRSISATLSVAAADVAVAGVLVHLRDGATGAGTILWSKRLAIVAAGGLAQVELSGLNITGSVNTAMTLEFAAAPGAASFEDVAITGLTVD